MQVLNKRLLQLREKVINRAPMDMRPNRIKSIGFIETSASKKKKNKGKMKGDL